MKHDFNNSCLKEKSKLELDLERKTSDLWVSTHVTDHAHLKDVVINKESNCIFQIIPALEYVSKTNNANTIAWISSSEFQKKVVAHEGISSLKFECKENSDKFYVTAREKNLARVYTFPSTNDFHQQVVEKFALSNKDSASLKTVYEGIVIKGKTHGRARIMVHDGAKVYIFAIATFREGVLDGTCTYITSDNFTWLRTSFSKGAKSDIEIEI